MRRSIRCAPHSGIALPPISVTRSVTSSLGHRAGLAHPPLAGHRRRFGRRPRRARSEKTIRSRSIPSTKFSTEHPASRATFEREALATLPAAPRRAPAWTARRTVRSGLRVAAVSSPERLRPPCVPTSNREAVGAAITSSGPPFESILAGPMRCDDLDLSTRPTLEPGCSPHLKRFEKLHRRSLSRRPNTKLSLCAHPTPRTTTLSRRRSGTRASPPCPSPSSAGHAPT